MSVFDAVKGCIQVFCLRRRHHQAIQNVLRRQFAQHCKFVCAGIQIISREEFQSVDADAEVKTLGFSVGYHRSNIIVFPLLVFAPYGGCIRLIRAFVKGASNVIAIIVCVFLLDLIFERHPSCTRPKTRCAVGLPPTIRYRSSYVATDHEVTTPLKMLHSLLCLYDKHKICHLQSELQSNAKTIDSHGRGSRPCSISKARDYNA
mmetsp:Transcript_13903/g.30179  ORF Transcript_13903/g.30179 Transcript_13903/m.30179 type:complete len:204 (+) Transcript_13903:2242-2853(+)